MKMTIKEALGMTGTVFGFMFGMFYPAVMIGTFSVLFAVMIRNEKAKRQ